MGNPEADSASKSKPKRSSQHFFIMMGMGILSAIAVVLLMMNASRMDHEGTVGREQVDKPAMSAEVPILTASGASLPPSEPAPKLEEAKSVAVEPPVAPSAAVPVLSVAEEVPSAPVAAPAVAAVVPGPTSTTKSASISGGRSVVNKPPEPQIKGFVNITCNPSCDEVFIDGRSFGPSPVVRAEIAVGLRSVRGRRRNQPDARTQVNVEERKTVSATIN